MWAVSVDKCVLALTDAISAEQLMCPSAVREAERATHIWVVYSSANSTPRHQGRSREIIRQHRVRRIDAAYCYRHRTLRGPCF